jgi:maltose alpha-D-glucosyltransferase/alpha-amylase
MFGRTAFPRVGELPYLLTIGPHGFYWFNLPSAVPVVVHGSGERDALAQAAALPALPGARPLAERFERLAWDELEPLLPEYLHRRRLGPAGGVVNVARVQTTFPLRVGTVDLWILLVRVEYREGMPETVSVPLTLVSEADLHGLLAPVDACGFARLTRPEHGVLCHAMAVPECCRAVLRAILDGITFRIGDDEIAAVPLPGAAGASPNPELPLTVRRSERNNTSVEFGEVYILKTFRRLEDGTNPDLELGRYLTRHPTYNGSAAVAGYIEYRRRGATPATLAVLHEFVPNQGTAWQYTLDHLSGYFERVAALSREERPVPPPDLPLTGDGEPGNAHDRWRDLLGGFPETARQLGRRTAELHLALAANTANPAFTPEPFDKLYQRSIYQTMRNRTGKVCNRLARERMQLPPEVRELADRVVGLRDELMRRFRAALDPVIGGMRFRVHGDFHLGQLLFTGKDFVVIDFEGEADRTIEDRRLKRSPLRDVAGMIRSFDYAARSVLLGLASRRGSAPGVIRPEDRPTLEPWADAWVNRVAREYVGAYLAAAEPGGWLPPTPAARRTMIELFAIEKAIHEVENELTTRLSWIEIPLHAVIRMAGPPKPSVEL